MKILMAAMGLDIGGAETHIVELAKELTRQGHTVIVASNGGVYVEEIEAAGVRHVQVPMHRRSAGLMAASLARLRRLIREERPDVVHAHARIPAFLCGILKKQMGFPLVATAHWVFDPGGLLGMLTNWGDRTIAVSEDIRQYLTDNYRIPRENIVVTINGIDTDKFSPELSGERVRRELDIPPDAPVVSHVSRLDASRADAAEGLIRVAPELSRRVPGVRILIAGGGDRGEELEALAGQVNLELGYRCLVMAGPRTDINEICAAGDVFVGVSRAALEAMAAARPVVIAGNEGYMGLFDEDKLDTGIEGNFCCRGCPAMTEDALLEDVTRALTLPEQERARLAGFGRQVVMEHYSVGRMARDALTAYRAALPPRRVVLSGYYGFGNAGDDAILGQLLRTVRELEPEARVTVLSMDPKSTERIHGCGAVFRYDPVRVARALGRCDLLISGGGSLLQDRTSTRSILYYTWVIRKAQNRGRRVFICANGIGPVTRPKNRERVKRCVELADAVSLRDPDSLRELRDIGVTREDIVVTADPVFLAGEPQAARTRELLERLGVRGDYVAVSVRPYKGHQAFFEKLAQVLDGVSSRCGVDIVFVSMQPRRDGPVSRTVRDLMKAPSHILEGDFTPEELMGVIGESRAVLSMRLHALLFAARMAVPALGFIYDPKVKSYLELLRQPSAGEEGTVNVQASVEAVAAILQRREDLAARLRDTRDAITADAQKNTEILSRLLERL